MKLLTVRQAAKASGIGYGLLRSLIKSGELPVVLVPGRQFALVDPADLERVIEGWKSGSLLGSTENSEVAEPQSSPAQTEKSHTIRPRGVGRSKVIQYKRFKG